jgi:hypothetical protein
VKVGGKGSFLNSDNLKEFAREMLDQGYGEFVVDLADCATMDSTFMETMARLALRRAEAAHGEHEKRTGQRDANWPDWYANCMVAEQAGTELPQ